jgi:penicillin-binding protein 1A
MVLKIGCPNCKKVYRLKEPLPSEGKKYRCTCGTVLVVTYPNAVREELSRRGLEMNAQLGETTGEVPEESSVEVPAPRPQAPEPRTPAAPAPEPAAPEPAAPEPAAPEPATPQAPATPPPAPAVPSEPVPPDSLEAPTVRTAAATSPTQKLPAASSPVAGPAVVSRTLEPAAASKAPEPAVASKTPEPTVASKAPEPTAASKAPEPTAASKAHEPTTASKAPEPTSARKTPERTTARKPEAAAKADKAAKKRPGFIRRVLFGKWTRRLVAATLLLILAGIGTGIYIIWYHSRDLPSVEALRDYRPPIVTQIYSADGRLVGEVYEKQRYVVPYAQIPEHQILAFVAAEDAMFFEHHGIDYMGILRAMIRNLEAGEFSQGGSTITQQVARSFLLTREKKISRKIKEAVLAYRIEKNFSKEYILYLYLNQIFLGHGAYGVDAASQLYFGKHIEDISLSEAAMIAGLPQAPSNYSPNNSFSSAKVRQRYVLDQMVAGAHITQEVADAAYDEALVFHHKRDKNLDVGPYFVEYVRRYLVDQYGHDMVYREGLTIYTTMDSELQLAANKALRHGVRAVDHRVGLTEEWGHVEGGALAGELAKIDLERYLAILPYDPSTDVPTSVPAGALPPLREAELTRGVVTEVHDKYVWVDVGSHRGILHHADGKWAYEPMDNIHLKWRQIASMRGVYEVGDVITIRVINPDESWKKTLGKDVQHPRLALDQEPQVEGAMMSMRLHDGAVLAMVGGFDYRKSEFDRSTQAKRQVGSTFKPFVYASALDCNRNTVGKCGPDQESLSYTPSSIIVDSPIVGFKPKAGGGTATWKPANAGGDFLGDTTLRRGMILSRNIVTLKIAQAMGISYLYHYMDRFGFETELEPNLSMALGTASLSIEEMVQAYSVFAKLGDRQGTYYVRQGMGRDGQVLEERTAGEQTPEVMDEVTAYQMVRLMRDVVGSGTATKALVLGVPLQGKTGTTNDYKDAWFMGYNAQVVTGVWVGYDDFGRSLGRGQYGGDCALPIWIDYMRAALEKYPETEFIKPSGVEFVRVEPTTGLLIGDEMTAGISVAFRRGTAPTSYAYQEGEVDSSDFLTSDGGL